MKRFFKHISLCTYKYMFICNAMKLKPMKSVLFLFLLFPILAQAQESKVEPLSLEQAISRALGQNIKLSEAQLQVDLAEAKANATNQFFLPRLSFSETAVFTNSPLDAFGFKLLQRDVEQSDFAPSRLTDPGNVSNFTTALTLEVPLLNPATFAYRKAALSAVEAAAFQKAYAEKMVRLRVKQTYFALLLNSESLKVLDRAQEALLSLLANLKDQQEAGYVHEVDVLKVEVKESELQSQRLEYNNSQAQLTESLHYLMGDSSFSNITLTDSLPADMIGEIPSLPSSLESRVDIQAQAAGIQALEYQGQANQKKWIPNINAFGNYSFYDEQPLELANSYYQGGLSLQWDLFSGLENHYDRKVSQTEIASSKTSKQAHEEQAMLELRNARRAVLLWQNKIEVQKKSLQQAQKALQLEKDRFNAGLTTTDQLLRAETTVSERNLQVLEANYQYYIALETYKTLLP